MNPRAREAIVFGAVAMIGSATAASAQTSGPTPPPPPQNAPPSAPPSPPPIERQWYGWQTLLADAPAFIVMGALGSSRTAGDAALVAFPLNVFGGPIVHFAHQHVGKGIGDIAMRLGFDLIGGLYYFSCQIGSDEADKNRANCVGSALLGFAGGAALDALILANEDVEAPAPTTTTVRWTPTITPLGRAPGVGIMGAF